MVCDAQMPYDLQDMGASDPENLGNFSAYTLSICQDYLSGAH
ncbi:MAG: hypothetical protein RLZZ136_1696 [Pseudomonadota bacterium]|jgi:hypothetical protein